MLALVLVAVLLLGGTGRAAAQTSGNGAKGTGAVKPLARTLERGRQKLEVKDDQEWKIIQDRLERVLRAQREFQNGLYSSKSRGLAGGAKKVDAAAAANGPTPGGRPTGGSDTDGTALRKLLDTRVDANQLKMALTRVRENLKRQQDELDHAQEDLRCVLTPRQEAIAILNGWLR